MMTRHFSAITPQQAPLPRAAWQASALAGKTACVRPQWARPGSRYQRQRHQQHGGEAVLPVGEQVAPDPGHEALGAHGRRARRDGLKGVGHGASQRSMIATRLLYQFISAEVPSDVHRYTSMMMAMHSTARPVWLSVVLAMETTSG